jgi:hypothetical protein
MFAVKSYLHSWCFQCSSRPISKFLTVFACITDSGRLFHISTILEAVWSPFKVGDIEKIENVQRRATKQVPTLKNMEYNERLKKLKMPTLKYRRMRGDMIEVFKIINNMRSNQSLE